MDAFATISECNMLKQGDLNADAYYSLHSLNIADYEVE